MNDGVFYWYGESMEDEQIWERKIIQEFWICCVQFEMTENLLVRVPIRLYEFIAYERNQDYKILIWKLSVY